MRNLSAWFRSHPITAILAAFVALCIGMHFFLNWKAERRWEAYVKEARARGVKLYLTEFAPPKIPDDQNFAALPMMRAMMEPGAKSPMSLPGTERPSFGNPLKGERLDWKQWQEFFKDAGFISETTDSAPRDVMRALEHYSPQFQEWSEWKTRPRCRFDLDLKAGAAIPFPHLGIFLDATKLFSLRTRAHLALAESPAAYGEFLAGLQTYRGLTEEPALISGLVRIATLHVMISAVGDGLLNHSWADAELHKIAADIGAIRIWDDYTSAFASERGFGNEIEEGYIKMSPWKRANAISAILGLPGFSGPPIGFWPALLIPDRMVRDNQLRANRYFDELLDRVGADGTKYNPDGATPSDADHLRGNDEMWFALFKISAPVFASVGERFVFLQTQLDLARIAIAIERFQIARMALPDSLSELAPEFIPVVPNDIYAGRPMSYRRSGAKSYTLYSVGPNRSDDGGGLVKTQPELDQSDWVWPH